jgi:hypothetical protein
VGADIPVHRVADELSSIHRIGHLWLRQRWYVCVGRTSDVPQGADVMVAVEMGWRMSRAATAIVMSVALSGCYNGMTVGACPVENGDMHTVHDMGGIRWCQHDHGPGADQSLWASFGHH